MLFIQDHQAGKTKRYSKCPLSCPLYSRALWLDSVFQWQRFVSVSSRCSSSSGECLKKKAEERRCVSGRGCRAEQIQAGEMMVFWGRHVLSPTGVSKPETQIPPDLWPLFGSPATAPTHGPGCLLLNDCLTCLVRSTFFMPVFPPVVSLPVCLTDYLSVVLLALWTLLDHLHCRLQITAK